MSSFLVVETPLSRIRPVEPGLRPNLFELTQALMRNFEPDEAAQIAEAFADPVPGEGRAAIDWYTNHPENAVAISALAEEEASKVLEAAGAIRARLLKVVDGLKAAETQTQDARLLSAATNVPVNKDFIYSAGGKPVIVAWGYRLADTAAMPVPAGKWVERKTDPSTLDTAAMAGHSNQAWEDGANDRGVMVAPGPVVEKGPPPLLAWLLWAVFLFLVLCIAYALLTACSAGLPRLSLSERGPHLLNRCPVPVVSTAQAADAERERGDVLRRAIKEAELALARNTQTCRVDRIREAEVTQPPQEEPILTPEEPNDQQETFAPPQPPQEEPILTPEEPNDQQETFASPQPPQEEPILIPEEPNDQQETFAPPQPPNEEVERALERVLEMGGQEGEYQVILEWDGPADLDVYIECGGETISYRDRANCSGGSLDVDANHSSLMDRPVESVRWDTKPAPGAYDIRVRKARGQGDSRSETPFKVHVKRGEEVETYEGSVGTRQTVDVTQFTVE